MPNLKTMRPRSDPDPAAELLEEEARCDCELSGDFCCGVPGVLAYLEYGRVPPDCQVERCDACERFASDAAAVARLRELGLFAIGDPRSLEPDERLQTYTVHCYAIVRVKLPGIPAGTPREAACRASDLFDWDRHHADAEFADEISEYLVDIDGDEDFSGSKRFDGNLNPVPVAASRETGWLLVINNETFERIEICRSHESAFQLLHEYVREQWEGIFGDEPLDPDPASAVQRFFDVGPVSYTLEERSLL
jgi:hypothetical protein